MIKEQSCRQKLIVYQIIVWVGQDKDGKMVSGGKCDFPQVMKSNWCHFPVFPDQILGQAGGRSEKAWYGVKKDQKKSKSWD